MNNDFGDGTSAPANTFHVYNAGNTNSDIAVNISSTAIQKNAWNHVVFSFSQPNMSIYVNGVLQGVATNAAWTVLRSYQTSTNSSKWVIGDSIYTTNSNSALFDQFRAFNRAITQSEVLKLYNNY